MSNIITGYDAIDYAEQTGAELHKYADPTEGARDDITINEAREIAAEDPSLVWVEVEPKTFTGDDAAEYAQGWGSYEAVKATAEQGVAEEDLERLADAGFDPDQAAEVLLAYCRERAAI